MGLDMYLYAEKSISAYDYETINGEVSRRDNLEYDKTIEASGLDTLPTAQYPHIEISKCVAYWRKANAIHGWIVRNCANGVDKCQRIEIDFQDMKGLRDSCLIALAHRNKALPNKESGRVVNLDEINDDIATSITESIKAESQKIKTPVEVEDTLSLEPTDGFFFGSTDKDEWYYKDIEYTVDVLNSLIAHGGGYRFYYQASW